MKKTNLAVLFLSGALAVSAAAGLAACKQEEAPATEKGVSTTLSTNKSPDELTPENAIYAFLQKQTELRSYKITSEGTAVANIAGYKQDIHNTTYKNGDDYLNEASSSSVLVNMKHQSFSKNGKVVYRNSFGGEMKVAEKADYVGVYGFTADDVSLGGYIINARTLRYATLEEKDGDTFTFYMRLAGDKSVEEGSATESSTAAVRLQTKAYGSLDNLPAFSDVDMRLTVKKDWTPVSYSSSCSYEAKKIFGMSVSQSLTSVYSEIGSPVAIPSVEEFNQQLGTVPSEVEPYEGETDALMQLASTVGASFGEQDALAIPVSLSLGASAQEFSLAGELSLRLRKEALGDGLSDAFVLRFDLDLSGVPYLSQLASKLSVRYVGDGLLLVTLNDGADRALFTYSADLGNVISSLGGFSLEQLKTVMQELFTLEKTDSGFRISPKESTLAALNNEYSRMIAALEERLGDTRGYLRSLLGFTFTRLEAGLEGTEKIEGISLTVKADPAENVTTGEKIGVSVDIGLPLNTLLMGPFTGDLDLRLNPAAILAGDFYAVAEAQLHLDLTPVSMILGLVGTFAPEGSLPPFVGPALNSLDVYYTGDGVLTLTLNNEENQPLFVTQVDLKTVQMPALPENLVPSLLSEFRFEKKENGILFALGAPIVKTVDEAYSQLVQTAVDFITQSAGDMGSIAGPLVQNMIGAQITDLEFFLGTNDDGKVMFDFAIKGIPTYDAEEDYSERRLLALTFTDRDPLTAEQQTALSACKETADALLARNAKDNETAAAFATKLQPYIENVALTEEYVQAVDALKEEFDAFPANVQTLVSNASYMADTEYNEETYSKLHVIYEMYLERADAFKALLPEDDDYAGFENWDAINSLYDKADTSHQYDLTVVIPAVKDSAGMKTYIGEVRITAYETARDTHENALVEELNEKIAASKTKYENATTHNDLTAALTEIVNDFKPAYDKLTAETQQLVTDYRDYVAKIYEKNIDGVTAEYNTVKSELETLVEQGKDASIENLLQTMKKLSSAYAWYNGNDYWTSNLRKDTMMAWGNTWVSSLKPTWLAETEQTALDQKVTALTELDNELIKGETEKTVATTLKDVIKQAGQALYAKIGECRIDGEGGTEWDFTKFDSDENNAALLEQLHGFRFMFSKVLPTTEGNAIWDSDADLKYFASLFVQYEREFANYLAKSAEGPQA